MRIKLKQPYLSIKQLTVSELPDFTMLIGRNGVGKTQLLEAIQTGRMEVSGIPQSEIVLYNLDSFRPQDSKPSGWHEASLAEHAAEKYLSDGSKTAPAELAKGIFEETIRHFNLTDGSNDRRVFEDELRNAAADLWQLRDQAQKKISGALSSFSQRIHSDVLGPLQTTNRRERESENAAASLVFLAMRLSRKLPHQITRDDILRAGNFEGDIIENTLSKLFTRYKVEQFSWAHTEGESNQESFQTLIERYRKENIPPWVILRQNLDRMHEAAGDPELFDFDFSDPEEDSINFASHSQYVFETKLTNRATGDMYSVTNLSSGEKILMTLFLAAFNGSIGRRLPKLVLLDEIDVVLHPSMISALIVGAKNQFVANGTRVIMATHSLTTVAMLEEGEIFRVSRNGSVVDVSPVTKSEAISDLSEGIATIDTGLRIAAYDAKPITILTEGHNALHLKKWASLFFPNDVDVIEDLRDKTGKNQLRTYGQFLARVNTNSHFLIVWDCDAQKTANALAKELSGTVHVTAFSFEQRENEIALEGIENKYDEGILEPFSNRTTEIATGREVAVSLSKEKKTEFAEFIYTEGTVEHFEHFDDLQMVANGILDKKKHKG